MQSINATPATAPAAPTQQQQQHRWAAPAAATALLVAGLFAFSFSSFSPAASLPLPESRQLAHDESQVQKKPCYNIPLQAF
jgi:predicted benzoate:H+ symporter BenE